MNRQHSPLPPPTQVVHHVILGILVVNFCHLLFLQQFHYNLYLNWGLAGGEIFWWNPLSYMVVQPLFLSPVCTLYSSITLLLFWLVAQEMAQRMGGGKFLLFVAFAGLGTGLVHLLWSSKSEMFGLAGPLFALMALSWWYYPTRWVFDRIKLRVLIFQGAFFFALFSAFFVSTSLDTLSPLAGLGLGVAFLYLDSLFQRLVQHHKQYKISAKKTRELWIRQELDRLLEQISLEESMDNLTYREKRFLIYASKYFQQTLKQVQDGVTEQGNKASEQVN